MLLQLHHVFAAGDFVVGEGAEHAGSKFHAPLQAPYHTVIPAGKFDSDRSRLVNIHIIKCVHSSSLCVMPVVCLRWLTPQTEHGRLCTALVLQTEFDTWCHLHMPHYCIALICRCVAGIGIGIACNGRRLTGSAVQHAGRPARAHPALHRVLVR